MRVSDRNVPVPVLLSALLGLCLLVALVVARPDGSAVPVAPAADGPAAAKQPGAGPRRLPPPPPPPPANDSWSGYAFDACRAPSQRTMDRWLRSSPFTGVGIYLGGVHRACGQRHLTPGWVTRQVRSGWKLLPIWVGPQASCTGYHHRISWRPGTGGRYLAARVRGVQEARRAVRTARALRVPGGEVLFYDIEPFDVRRADCRRSSLAFLDSWTREMHRGGYRSGVYSHVNSGISLLSRTGRDYARPDAVWYAYVDRVGTIPTKYVGSAAFMRASRVHQYALDTRVDFGGVRMDIDWNYVSLGAVGRAVSPAGCDQLAGRVQARPVRQGARGLLVRVLQCLVLPGSPHPTKTSGRFDPPTLRALRAFQRRHGLAATPAVDRRTWTSLLAQGYAPVLRKGARGEPVRRLQRSLNVAAGRTVVRVDGAYGRTTARVVRHYRARVGLGPKGVASRGVWKALSRGVVLPARRR
ncbi:MAG TPA: glycoside hydrolase domain-containing protein [Nocardioides sp.]|nr:glycoside hydrolase domain-containing protein [Nocardioides sp.]